MSDLDEEQWYFDVIACSPAERLTEAITKTVAAVLVAVFALSEFRDQLTEYRVLRRAKRATTHG